MKASDVITALSEAISSTGHDLDCEVTLHVDGKQFDCELETAEMQRFGRTFVFGVISDGDDFRGEFKEATDE